MLNYDGALRECSAGDASARLSPPTLIPWAGDDAFLERRVVEAGLALCDDGRLEVIEGTSHRLHLEAPDRIDRRIVDFLRSGA